jgi:hypothetical protein
MNRILVLVAVVACTPPADPIGARPQYAGQQPYGQQPYAQPGQLGQPGQPGQPPGQTAGTANCGETLSCYAQCNMDAGCLAGCDGRAQPGAAQPGRAVLDCLVQSGCQDDQCAAQRCSAQIATCQQQSGVASGAQGPGPNTSTAGPTTQAQPAPAASSGSFDLVFTPPVGFAQDRAATGLLKLTRHEQVQAGTDFYGTRDYILLEMPAEAPAGSLAETTRALWKEHVIPFGVSVQEPIIHRRRLKSGYGVGFDGATFTTKNGAQGTVVLLAITSREKVVPFLFVFFGSFESKFENEFAPMLDAATIRGGTPVTGPLYEASEVAGKWTTQSTSIADYVNSSGQYTGDASIATAEYIDLEKNGKFASTFIGIRGSVHIKEKGSGTWSTDDDGNLVVNDRGSVKKRRIFAMEATQKIQLAPSYDSTMVPEYSAPSRQTWADWFVRN